MSTPTLSLIIPVFNEEDNLPLLLERLSRIVEPLEQEIVEFIFIDDGSTDASFEILAEHSVKDSRIKALRLSRNFGSHPACLAGLAHARGERMIIITADLQDPPELIPKLLKAQTSGIELVWAVRNKREETGSILFFATLYNYFMKRFVFPEWPGEGADVVLLSRRVRDALMTWPEKNTPLFGQIFWLGFPHATIRYDRQKRHAGKSKWNFSKRLKTGLDSVISFSFLPIRLISFVGILISIAGFSYAIFVIALRLFHFVAVPGWTMLMVVTLILSGLQLLMLGVIGEYLWRSAEQVKSRPFYVVNQKLGFEDSSPVPEIARISSSTNPEE